MYPILPVSVDCPFLIAPSVFSDVYKSIEFVYHEMRPPDKIYSNIFLFCFQLLSTKKALNFVVFVLFVLLFYGLKQYGPDFGIPHTKLEQ